MKPLTVSDLESLEKLTQNASTQTADYLNNKDALKALAIHFADGRKLENGLPQWELGYGSSANFRYTVAEIGHRAVKVIGWLVGQVERLRCEKGMARADAKVWCEEAAVRQVEVDEQKQKRLKVTVELEDKIEELRRTSAQAFANWLSLEGVLLDHGSNARETPAEALDRFMEEQKDA